MNYNRARAVINRVMQEGGYIGKCTHSNNEHCANHGSGQRFCNVTTMKSCMGCRFATIGGSGERIIVAEKITALEKQQDALKRDIKHAIDKKDAEYIALLKMYEKVKPYEGYDNFLEHLFAISEGEE